MIFSQIPIAHHQLIKPLRDAANFIRAAQAEDGSIAWTPCGKLDPWDHIEAAMGLAVAGDFLNAQKAYRWLARHQLNDGSWYAEYFVPSPSAKLREPHFIAYIATGLWHYFLLTRDTAFLQEFWPTLRQAINFVLTYQNPEGDVDWAVNEAGDGQHDALVTGCSSILRSLECACLIAQQLQLPQHHWHIAWQTLRTTLLTKPERFDRTWASKARFAMDWYYPILAGIYSVPDAQQRLAQRWDEFVVEGLGCRCVSDEPWVTVAETSELIIALCAAKQTDIALQLFTQIQRWQDTDGGYWTGYVFRDNSIWPQEKTTWTAGAVILAADAIFRLTAAAGLFGCVVTDQAGE